MMLAVVRQISPKTGLEFDYIPKEVIGRDSVSGLTFDRSPLCRALVPLNKVSFSDHDLNIWLQLPGLSLKHSDILRSGDQILFQENDEKVWIDWVEMPTTEPLKAFGLVIEIHPSFMRIFLIGNLPTRAKRSKTQIVYGKPSRDFTKEFNVGQRVSVNLRGQDGTIPEENVIFLPSDSPIWVFRFKSHLIGQSTNPGPTSPAAEWKNQNLSPVRKFRTVIGIVGRVSDTTAQIWTPQCEERILFYNHNLGAARFCAQFPPGSFVRADAQKFGTISRSGLPKPEIQVTHIEHTEESFSIHDLQGIKVSLGRVVNLNPGISGQICFGDRAATFYEKNFSGWTTILQSDDQVFVLAVQQLHEKYKSNWSIFALRKVPANGFDPIPKGSLPNVFHEYYEQHIADNLQNFQIEEHRNRSKSVLVRKSVPTQDNPAVNPRIPFHKQRRRPNRRFARWASIPDLSDLPAKPIPRVAPDADSEADQLARFSFRLEDHQPNPRFGLNYPRDTFGGQNRVSGQSPLHRFPSTTGHGSFLNPSRNFEAPTTKSTAPKNRKATSVHGNRGTVPMAKFGGSSPNLNALKNDGLTGFPTDQLDWVRNAANSAVAGQAAPMVLVGQIVNYQK